MLSILLERWRQGYRTKPFPPDPSALSDRFRGRPRFDPALCMSGCAACAAVCPTGAVARSESGSLALDLARCVFCGACADACRTGALRFTPEYRLAARRPDDLVADGQTVPPVEALRREIRRVFGRSLKLRQVSAGGCNACEADANVLTTPVFDLGRFGIQFVASPRHADGLLITGPVTENMRDALWRTWEATPAPRIVIACGACALSGGLYAGHPETHGGAAAVVPVDLCVPGCPPHPYTLLDGMLRLLGRHPATG